MDAIELRNSDIVLAGDVAGNPAAHYLAGLSKGARRTQQQALNVIVGILTAGVMRNCMAFDWSRVNSIVAAAVRSRLAERYKPATANRMLAAIRGTMTSARMLKLIDVDTWQDLTAPKYGVLKTIRGASIPAGRALASGEIGALMADCESDQSPAGARDAAIISLGYGAGLRRAELVSLDLADFEAGTGCLKVTGKGRKERTAYVTGGALAALQDWLDIRGSGSGPLFMAIGKGGKIRAGRLTTQAIYNMLIKRADSAGLSHFSPHDMRRTFITDMLDAGADISIVAQMAGHANTQTTRGYDRRPEAAKAKAAGLLHIPYQPRKRR